MEENDLYIEKLKQKLSQIDDPELYELVQKLIEERNYISSVANIDYLTGLNNRRILSRIRTFNSVLMCDIDDFKSVNDNYGHDVGDKAIKSVAKVLNDRIRVDDYICRFGGDEFIIAFKDCPEEIVIKRAKEIVKELENKEIIPGCKITISIGIAFRDNEESITDVIKKADIALYESKENGKSQVSLFEEEKKKTKVQKNR